ncbi:Clavaminate synthase-like protein [Byssothecium circinans]|uniref:Clavaminate synthase-like protein n=1 Tax=Byssothecium circinans TaxID=147558 RepID=A0A6A5TKI9_9PLEO|nr:Clavaminate synthase-like protein [Byssothecium circinans]
MASVLLTPVLEGVIVQHSGSEKPAITPFNIPHSRSVHGNTFLLGLKLEPSSQTISINEAVKLVDEQAGTLKELLGKHGAILFRNFPIKFTTDFQAFVRAFKLPNPHHEVGLSGKRTTVTDDVKTANEEPPDVKFSYHSGYGGSAHFPGILFFYSQIAKGEWQSNGALQVVQKLPAIRKIASTGKPIFFNGFVSVYGRARDNHALEAPYKGDDEKYHFPTTYGDGLGIPIKYLERLLKLSDEIGFLVPWEESHVSLIDNFTVQHARSPWVGKRSLLASLWDGHGQFLTS